MNDNGNIEITSGKVMKWDGEQGTIRTHDGISVAFTRKHVATVGRLKRWDMVRFQAQIIEWKPVYKMKEVLAIFDE